MNIIDKEKFIQTPIWASRLLRYFLSGALIVDNRGLKYELVYLLLPFMFNENLYLCVKNKNKDSSYHTAFDEPVIENNFDNVNNEIKIYKRLTNKGLIYLGNKVIIFFQKQRIKMEKIYHYKSEKNEFLNESYKTAYNLGCILAKDDHINILLRIGVKKI